MERVASAVGLTLAEEGEVGIKLLLVDETGYVLDLGVYWLEIGVLFCSPSITTEDLYVSLRVFDQY